MASPEVGRVLIAFDDGPLEPAPTYTAIDQGGDFPYQFCAGWDAQTGRQTLRAQTDTGTATVYINDHESALFDPRNSGSPYYGKLDGKQILLQIYDPVRAVWEERFQGLIDEVTWDVDGSAIDANGDPVNESIQIHVVDLFDFFGSFGLTPGLDGVKPPKGSEAAVYYGQTLGSMDDRILEILMDVSNDANWVDLRTIVFSGNVHLQETKYNADEFALQALRDACDAELPFIANMYCDRKGRYVFHGRYSRFDPDAVAAQANSNSKNNWDFHRWKVGDGKAIASDSNRAQMRILSFLRSRGNIINAALCSPEGIKPEDMKDQVYADLTSIGEYGRHSGPAISNLITQAGIRHGGSPTTANEETFLYAELLVKNQKDPREAISALKIKTIHPDDHRAATTWALLSQCDISDIVNVKVGYPGGTGFSGASPADDYYVEGMTMQVRPMAGDQYDYVELDLNVSPAVWSQDTHGVFPPYPGSSPSTLISNFTRVIFGGDLSVNVTDTSTHGPSGLITAWDWDWGDGSPHDTTQNASHVYAAPDVYAITLTVTGTAPDGTDLSSQTVTIT